MQLQVVVGSAGRRRPPAASRSTPRPRTPPDDAGGPRHASGSLIPETGTPDFDLAQLAAGGRRSRSTSTACYETLAAHGLGYGPAFQGLRAAWRAGGEVFAEVALPESITDQAKTVRCAPGAAGRGPARHGFASAEPVSEETRIPFAWGGVSLHATGASALRVRITATGADEVSLELADAKGDPVAGVESLVVRAVSADKLRAAAQRLAVPARLGAGLGAVGARRRDHPPDRAACR